MDKHKHPLISRRRPASSATKGHTADSIRQMQKFKRNLNDAGRSTGAFVNRKRKAPWNVACAKFKGAPAAIRGISNVADDAAVLRGHWQSTAG
jgi:hypothetical protein